MTPPPQLPDRSSSPQGRRAGLPKPNSFLSALVLSAVLTLPAAQAPANAQDADTSLPFSAGYLVTGNYVDGAVDLTEQANPPDAEGLSTGIIHISGVPTEAEI